MTENEANMSIKYAVCVLEAIGNGLTLSNENDREDACAFAIQALEEIQQYRAIGTIEEFKDLKEKSVAKKAKWIFDDFTVTFGNPYHCSNCDEEFGDTYNYCPNCGCSMYD